MKFKFNKLPGNAKTKRALAGLGGSMGIINPLMFDKEVTDKASSHYRDILGARGSAKDPGRSVDKAKDKKMGLAADQASEQQAAAAAAAAAAEEPYKKAQESQKEALKRKGRRASILTSSRGVDGPLGIPG